MLKKKPVIVGLIVLVFLVLFTWKVIWPWFFCHEWAGYGKSLLITRRLGNPIKDGKYSDPKVRQQGVLEQLRGPGRYLDLNPITYNVETIKDVLIPPLKFALVENKYGNRPEDSNAIIVGPKEKGFQRDLLTPGAWRINTYGQKAEFYGAKLISPGYVGVVTVNLGSEQGIQDKVLTPGYYNIHPKLMDIMDVEIGYRVWDSISILEDIPDANGGVSFPLADGKQMRLDVTVVWGVLPKNAPRIIREYGGITDTESKIIEAQVPSICKNLGSNLTTKEFIQGKTREEFQKAFTTELKKLGGKKGIDILIALVRGFYPDEEIKKTIQEAMLTEEEKKTLKIEQERDSVSAQLEKARQTVTIAEKDFDAETLSYVADANELGIKKAAEIRQEADREVAKILRQAAEVKRQSVEIIGQAEADVLEAIQGVEADKLKRFVAAYGGAKPYILAKVAESMSKDLEFELRETGIGTLWMNPTSGGSTSDKNSFSDSDIEKIVNKRLLQYLQMKGFEQSQKSVPQSSAETVETDYK